MKDQFHRILDLVRKTGDTMVVTDSNGEHVFVVMDLDQYEAMLDVNQFQEDELGDLMEEDEDLEAKEPVSDDETDIWGTMQAAGEDSETWDVSKMNEQELEELEDQYRQFAQRNVKDVLKSSERATVEANLTKKSANTEDFGEEQFYLEPIE